MNRHADVGILVGVGVLAAALSGCGGQVRDIGSNADGTSGTGGSATGSPVTGRSASGSSVPVRPLPDWPTCSADGGAPQEIWTGYVQGEGLVAANGDFTITMQRSGSQACGTLVFGEPTAPLPPATDAQLSYPPGLDYHTAERGVSGFSYTLLDATITGARLRFRLTFAEPWESWCELQTPYPNDAETSGYNCLPNAGVQEQGNHCVLIGPGPLPAASCAQVNLCDITQVCECNAERCRSSFQLSSPIGDFHLDGDKAQGVLQEQVAYMQRASTAP